MKTHQFIKMLKGQSAKQLLFEYRPGQYVPKSYHITEVKKLHIESVDCGGFEHQESQTVVQLWSPALKRDDQYMTAGKAAKIFDIVQSKNELIRDAEIFIEYGNPEVMTSVYKISNVEQQDDKIIVCLNVPPTVCKPKELLTAITDEVPCCGSNSSCCQ